MEGQTKGKIIAVVGPTASGKTALAIEIAKKYGGEVVSCDSMQIYKGMDIGTAKPTEDEMCGIKHHMIDIVSPHQSYSAADFAENAKTVINGILSRGALPVLAGGTGLYIDSVINNIKFGESPGSSKLRAELAEFAERNGSDALFRELRKKDPAAAEKIHPNNVRRVIRALEVCILTGRTFTEVSLEARGEKEYDALIFGLDMERSVLYERINKRVDIMMKKGLLAEVRRLRDMGVSPRTTAMQAIGYKELMQYLCGDISLDAAVEKIKLESRRYAKRQLTWFRRNEEIIWLLLQECYSFDKICEKCFTFINKFGIL